MVTFCKFIFDLFLNCLNLFNFEVPLDGTDSTFNFIVIIVLILFLIFISYFIKKAKAK